MSKIGFAQPGEAAMAAWEEVSIDRMFRIDGEAAWVTGAAAGFGRIAPCRRPFFKLLGGYVRAGL